MGGNIGTGGKPTLLGISKHGNKYLRTLLIHGAHSVIRAVQMQATPSTHPEDQWLRGLLTRRHHNVVAVALPAKTARIVWVLWPRGTNSTPTINPSSRLRRRWPDAGATTQKQSQQQ